MDAEELWQKKRGIWNGDEGRMEQNKKEDIENIRHKNESVQIRTEESKL